MIVVSFLAFGCTDLAAQLVVKLNATTLTAFEAYAGKVESSLNDRWSGKTHFLQLEDNQQEEALCLAGKLLIRQQGNGQPAQIPEGLIHDWLGAVYIPGVSIEDVLSVLEDFDKHRTIYPEVADSRTIQRAGHQVTGYWRLQQKGVVPVILDVEQQVRYEPAAPGKWKGHAYARKIVETDTTLFSRHRKFPQDEGHGYLWRLYSYWSLEARNGGVLAECRTLSLSRDIPTGLAWAVGPYVQKMPENSLTSTLEQTRKASRVRLSR